MEKSKFREEQIVEIFQEAAARQICQAELCRRHGISANTLYLWKRKYAGTEREDVRRLKEFEAENAALNRIVASQAVELEAGRIVWPACVPRYGVLLFEPSVRARS